MNRIRLTDVAVAAGVSLTTVSRAMNESGYVADDVKGRIEQAAQKLGYVHPEQKKPVKRKKLIGILTMNGKINPYLPNMTYTLQQTAAEKGYYCVCVTTERLDNESLVYHAAELARLGVSALVVTIFLAAALDDTARDFLLRLDLPIVFFERTEGCYGFNRILVDNSIGTYVAARHLLNKDHRHLVYITLSRQAAVESMRISGFKRAIDEFDRRDIKEHIVSCSEITPLAGAKAMKAALKTDPAITGVVAWSDLFAAGALHVFEQLGRRVPEEVEIIGYDNILAPHLPAKIGSIETPVEEMAAITIDTIDRCLSQKKAPAPKTVTLEPRLVVP
jgi:LacI family transcriptional regulator